MNDCIIENGQCIYCGWKTHRIDVRRNCPKQMKVGPMDKDTKDFRARVKSFSDNLYNYFNYRQQAKVPLEVLKERFGTCVPCDKFNGRKCTRCQCGGSGSQGTVSLNSLLCDPQGQCTDDENPKWLPYVIEESKEAKIPTPVLQIPTPVLKIVPEPKVTPQIKIPVKTVEPMLPRTFGASIQQKNMEGQSLQ